MVLVLDITRGNSRCLAKKLRVECCDTDSDGDGDGDSD